MSRLTLVLLILVSPACVAADVDEIYESLDNVRLGRLFLSPDERDVLEARRRLPTSDAIADSSGEASTAVAAEPPARPAAGIIVASGRQPLVWINGEFRRVESASVDTLRFPGAVRIQSTGKGADDDTEQQSRDAGAEAASGRPSQNQ